MQIETVENTLREEKVAEERSEEHVLSKKEEYNRQQKIG